MKDICGAIGVRNLNIQKKLMAFVGCAVTALIVFALVAFHSMSEIAVGSPLYQKNQAALAVASHFEINTQGIQSVHAMAIEAEEADTVAERNGFDKAIRAARQEFERGHQYYLQIVPPGPLHDVIAGPEYQSAEDWYNAAEKEFLPALEASDVPGADQIRTTKMARAYKQNLAAIEQITKLTDAWNAENDKASNDLVRSRTWLLIVCALLALTILVWMGLAIRADVVNGIARTMEGIEALANCDLTREVKVSSDDELGRMAAAMQKTTGTLRQVLSAIHTSAVRLSKASSSGGRSYV
jgi:methyl-accepting chemotaxis protein